MYFHKEVIVMNHELIIIWSDGSVDRYNYATEEEARRCENNFKLAFGNQVSWTGLVHKLV